MVHSESPSRRSSIANVRASVNVKSAQLISMRSPRFLLLLLSLSIAALLLLLQQLNHADHRFYTQFAKIGHSNQKSSVQLQNSTDAALTANVTVAASFATTTTIDSNRFVAVQSVPSDISVDPRYASWPTEASLYKLAPVQAVILYLAGKRESAMGGMGKWMFRRYILLNSLQSVDRTINSPPRNYRYPVYIFHEDFTEEDMMWYRAEIRTFISFVKIDLSTPPPFITAEQVERWYRGEDGGVKGRKLGYRMMCRGWSGPFQRHPALSQFDYYMRLDDDSVMRKWPQWDVFEAMKERKYLYAWLINMYDYWGIGHMWQKQKEFCENPLHAYQRLNKQWMFNNDSALNETVLSEQVVSQSVNMQSCMSRMRQSHYLGPTRDNRGTQSLDYNGMQPYNNFHISDLSLWRSELMIAWFNHLDQGLGFMKYRYGDANTHALLVGCLLREEQKFHLSYEVFEYQHNWFHSKRKYDFNNHNWINSTIFNDPNASVKSNHYFIDTRPV